MHLFMFFSFWAKSCPAPRHPRYQVCKSQDHLDAFQSVYRRLRRTGRDAEDKDVSDSMLKARLGMVLLTNTE